MKPKPDASSTVALKSRDQAFVYLQGGNCGRAFAHFLVALQLKPEWKSVLKTEFSLALCRWGEHLESHQRLKDLFNCYEQAIEIFPENECVICNLGSHLFRQLSSSLLKVLCDNLTSVNIGLKPSFLWDLPVKVDRPRIAKAISLLKDKELMSDNITILILADDLFIINVVEIETLFCNPLETFKFVDCSMKLDSAKVLENPKDIFEAIETIMTLIRKNETTNLLVIEERSKWYLPSLFGFLLGYPVVYWSSSCENNLSKEPLFLFKISYANESFELKNIYSFTIPSNVPLRSHVESWRKRLNERFSGSLIMTVSTVSFPSVIL